MDQNLNQLQNILVSYLTTLHEHIPLVVIQMKPLFQLQGLFVQFLQLVCSVITVGNN